MNGKVLLFRIEMQKRRIEESPIQTLQDYEMFNLLTDMSKYIREQETKAPVFQEGVSCQHIINNGEMNITI